MPYSTTITYTMYVLTVFNIVSTLEQELTENFSQSENLAASKSELSKDLTSPYRLSTLLIHVPTRQVLRNLKLCIVTHPEMLSTLN